MSTTTLDPRTGSAPSTTRPTPRLTWSGVLRSEWIKFRSLRANWLTLAGIFAAIVCFGLISAAVATGSTSGDIGGPGFGSAGSPVDTVLSGATFAVLVVAVLGVMVGAREYSSGLIRVSLAAVPSRLPVLLGKLAVFVAATATIIATAVLVAFFAGTAILDSAGVASASWSDAGVPGAVLGTIGYLVGIGVLGVLLGMLLRGIGAGIGVLIGGILFLPTLATSLLPDSWSEVLKYLPSNAGQAFSTTSASGLLDYWPGVAVFCAWILVALGGTAWSLVRRDA